MGSWRTPASAAKSLGEVFHRLTDRDRAIIDVLGRCKLMTVVQLSRIFFDSESVVAALAGTTAHDDDTAEAEGKRQHER